MLTQDFTLKWITSDKPIDAAGSTISGHYLDFTISGRSLKHYLRISEDHSVTPFGWFLDETEQATILKQYRLQSKPRLANNRIELYICPECGDIGCGAVTVEIADRGDRIVWSKFAIQTNPDEVNRFFEVEDLEFERTNYFAGLAMIR